MARWRKPSKSRAAAWFAAAGIAAATASAVLLLQPPRAPDGAEGYPQPFSRVDLHTVGAWWGLTGERPLEEVLGRAPEVGLEGAVLRQPPVIPAGWQRESEGFALPYRILGPIAAEAVIDLARSAKLSRSPRGRGEAQLIFSLGVGEGAERVLALYYAVDELGAPHVSCGGDAGWKPLPRSAATLSLRLARERGELTGWAGVDGRNARRLCRLAAVPDPPSWQVDLGASVSRPAHVRAETAYRTKGSEAYALRGLSVTCLEPDGCSVLGVSR